MYETRNETGLPRLATGRGLLVMPGKGNQCSWQPASDQVGDQGGQVGWVDGFAGRGQFGLSPPAVATVVSALELVQPSGVDLVTGDAVEEEVIAEQSAGPPPSRRGRSYTRPGTGRRVGR